ncbi:Wzt C-terminal domain-containing protein [Desulfacinum hydrothermale DSM 13146]|uniref:Wzt C-terminal domain-containing protein n=1 Tax=Desulfacinum hydrothermale DSM 13146 TaxID=1121390 RepID=A0A1W1XR89_9BACT|nr:ABC transporter ATP-binding protein [Desulfacinum hydrothermale]SMC26365.1 Wzt C-terminal domain-containing protein [Desulfacinum hydrothermale DSM 13146]
MAIIEVEHLTKEYRLGQLTKVGDTFKGIAARLRGRKPPERKAFKALDDVTFSVEEGEVVGIIGPNGAGKSTLLKILCGVTRPSWGNCIVGGKVAPLIEVGAGLVGDLTGRENIYLNGTILGLGRKEITSALGQIIEFAELEEFIDTPIKRYSSGMKVRLGFSIATTLKSEILIMDEVLAVGDMAFQRKCFDRMENLIKTEGRTILLVSHNMRQVERLCSRIVLLNNGRVIEDGNPKKVCDLYFEQSSKKIMGEYNVSGGQARNLRMTGEVILHSLSLLNEEGEESDAMRSGYPMVIQAWFDCDRHIESPEVVFGFHTPDLIYIASMDSARLMNKPNFREGKNLVQCVIPELPLIPGIYGLRVGVLDRYRREMFYGESIKTFSVLPGDIPVSKTAALGFIDIKHEWHINTNSVSLNDDVTSDTATESLAR